MPKRRAMRKRQPTRTAVLAILAVALAAGIYAAYSAYPPSTAIMDFYSCASAGNPVMESYPPRCIAGGVSYTEENCQSGGNILTLSDAIAIAKASECGDNLIVGCTCPNGYIKDGDYCNPQCYYSTPRCLAPSIVCWPSYACNENTATYWIDLNMTRAGCSPACVVYLANRTAEINWRCTGLITP